MNVVVIMGRITAQPELKTTPNGVNVTSFSVAVDRNYKGANGEKLTDFINVQAWRQTAKFICDYFKKGQMIAISGSLQSRSYTDQNGNKRTVYEVVAENVNFCGSKEEKPSANIQVNSNDFEEMTDDGDYPF